MQAHLEELGQGDQLVADNVRLIEETRAERRRHQGTIREAERKIRSGLSKIRRATLHVVSS